MEICCGLYGRVVHYVIFEVRCEIEKEGDGRDEDGRGGMGWAGLG